jgi:ribosome-associated toxin RatA of RatAB toxin-antitoxin module
MTKIHTSLRETAEMQNPEKISNWENYCSDSITIAAPAEYVYDLVYGEEPRPNFLPHIAKVDILYSDDVVQEFAFETKRADGSVARIRTVSRCMKNEIEFFQPQPPDFMNGYFVVWSFKPILNHTCRLTIENWWSLSNKAFEKFPEKDGTGTAEQIHQHILGYTRKALRYWHAKANPSIQP